MNAKKAYLAPTVTVVSFVTEQGFAGSVTDPTLGNNSTESLGNGGTISMGSTTSTGNGGFFNRNNDTEASGGLF